MKNNCSMTISIILSVTLSLVISHISFAQNRNTSQSDEITDGTVVKKVIDLDDVGENLLKADSWHGWQKGFKKQGEVFICDNSSDSQVQRGVSQNVTLNQKKPEPVIATAWSKAENVGGSRNSDYSLYLDR